MWLFKKQTPPTQAAESRPMAKQMQTPPTQAAESRPMARQMQTPPTEAAKAQPVVKTNLNDLEESKSSPAFRSAASLLDDEGQSAETSEEDMFIFSAATFKDLWAVCDGIDFQKQSEMKVKELEITKMENSGNSESLTSSFRSYRWAPSTPTPGMMQTIGLEAIREEGRVREPVLPISQGHPERVLGLPIVLLDTLVRDQRPYCFRSKYLCQLSPLMLPVMAVHNADLSSDQEWKLRDVLAKRTEKLRVLILLFDEVKNVETISFLLERLEDLLSDVNTVVLGNDNFSNSVYVIHLTSSKNRLDRIAMLVKYFPFKHEDKKSFVRTMKACTSQIKSWHVVEATVEFDPSIHALVSAYPKTANIHLSTCTTDSMNHEMKNNLAYYDDASGTPIDLSEFQNLRKLLCNGSFLNSSLQLSHGLRDLSWLPSQLTRFDDCAWGCLSNLQCISINGKKLDPTSRISLECFPNLVSLDLYNIAKEIVVDFGHRPLRLNDLQLNDFHGSLEGSDRLLIERLLFIDSVCDDAFLQLCPNSKEVKIDISKIDDACITIDRLSMIADQLKCLKLSFDEVLDFVNRPLFPVSPMGTVFPLLESLELVNCAVMLSAVTFPRLHHLSLEECDLHFRRSGIPGWYGDSFPELFSLAITNSKLLRDKAVPDDDDQDPVRVIHLPANSLFSLRLINVTNLKMLRIYGYLFPCLQSLQCHVANNDDFPFPLDKPGDLLFPRLRNLSLKKNALDGKKIKLDLLADMDRLEKLELLGNAFFTLDDMKPFQCSWVHFSSAIVEQENARRRSPAGLPIPMKLSVDIVTFAASLVSEKCENLIIDQHAVCLSGRHVAHCYCISIPILSLQEQTPPTQAAQAHPIAKKNHDDLAESKSSASSFAASSLNDGGQNTATPQDDMFFFSDATFKDLWAVCDGIDFQEQPEVKVKESANTKMENCGDSRPPMSGFISYRWASSAPIPGMMQTIGLVPASEEGLVGEIALPFSQDHTDKVLGLPIAMWNNRGRFRKPYCFRSKFLCQLNPLMLPVMEVHYGNLPTDEEWKLRDLLAKRKEKLRVLFLLFKIHENVETVLFSLERLEDLFSDVTTVVLTDYLGLSSVHVTDLTFSKNRLKTIAMLVKSFSFYQKDRVSFLKTMSAFTNRNESWHAVEATVEVDPSLRGLVYAYPKPANIHFSSWSADSMNHGMKNKLSNLLDSSGTVIDLSEFRNLWSLNCGGRFVNSSLQQPHGLRCVSWNPRELTRFNDCAWGFLSNIQHLTIYGEYLHPSSRISLQCFPKLISLSLIGIAESVVVDFAHLPLRLCDLHLYCVENSFEGSDQLRIEKLVLNWAQCDDAYLQLCPKADYVEIEVGNIEDACRRLPLVADQLKCLNFSFNKREKLAHGPLPFSSMGMVFPLLESLKLVRCSVMLSAVTFPRLRYLSIDECEVIFPKHEMAGHYGDVFPELVSLAITNSEVLIEGAVPNDNGPDPVEGFIHFHSNSLLSLKLINVSNLKMLRIHRHSFPRLQSLQCHVANDDDFPFPLDEPGEPLFPHLRNLSLKKNALDGKALNLDLWADMNRLESLELLENAFFTLDDMKLIQCRWVHFSFAVVDHKTARRFAGGMPIPLESLAERVAFGMSLVSDQCERLIIDQHVAPLPDRHLAQSNCISLQMLPLQKQIPPTQATKAHPISSLNHDDLAESKSSSASRSAASSLDDGGSSAETSQKQTPPTLAASSHSISRQMQTPPTPAAKAHLLAINNHEDLAESKSSSVSRFAPSLFDDGGQIAETPQEDMFVFSDTTFEDLWDVCASFDFQEHPEVKVKESALTQMKNFGDSRPPASGFKSFRWASSTPIPGMMQTIGLLPVTEEGGLVGESVLPYSQDHLERVLGLPIVAWNNRKKYGRPYSFRSKWLCQLNPLMLPVLKVHSDRISSEVEWKLRDVLSKRAEKLKVLTLLMDERVDTVLSLLGSIGDLLNDVTTFVFGDARFRGSVYVIDVTFSKDPLNVIATLLKSFTFQHFEEESFAKTMSACIAQNESWHVVEATIEVDPSLHAVVSAYPKSPNIHFSSYFAPSMNERMKSELSYLAHVSGAPIVLKEFRNLRSLDCPARFVNSALEQFPGLRSVHWVPFEMTRFNDCAWGSLSNLQCLSIDGENLHPSSRISLRCFPKLVSLSFFKIAKSIVIEFGHLPMRLHDLELCHFYGSLEGGDELQIEKLLFSGPVCSNVYVQLCPKSNKVEIEVCNIDEDACHRLSLVANQLKCLKLTFQNLGKVGSRPRFLFSAMGTVFSFLESLELVHCDMMLSAITFPRLHHLSLDKCDVLFPKRDIVGLYGDSFPELVSLALTNCKLLLDKAIPDDNGQNSVGFIHLQASSLFSLKLVNVVHLRLLQIHQQTFPRLQSFQCHFDNSDYFPFILDSPGVPLFPHLRSLSLKKNMLDGKTIPFDLSTDMGRLEKLELLDNALLTIDDRKPIECRWLHLSSAIVEQEMARRRFSRGMPMPMESSAQMVAFVISLVGQQCENLIINRDLCLFRNRANMDKWYPPMYGFTETSLNPAKV